MAGMNVLVKWLLIALAVIVLLAVLAAVLVKTLVDPQQYRALAVDAVERATGRTLTLEGEASLKLFPCCAVQVEKATLGNPAGFDAEQPFLRVSSARLAIRLWPLLVQREVRVGAVDLQDLDVNLISLADGRNNWTFTHPDAAADAPGGGDSAGLGNISFAGISITDGTLEYRDHADQSHYRIDDLDLATGAIENGEPFNLQASFNGHDLADNAGGRLKLRARATLDSSRDETGDATSVMLGDLTTSLDLRNIAGMATLSGQVASPSLKVRLSDNTLVAADEVTTDLKLAPADLPDASMAAKAVLGGFRYDTDADTGALAELKAALHVPGTDVEVTMSEPGTFGARTRLRGELKFAEFSPRAALVQLHQPVPSTADANVLKRLSGKAGWFVSDTEAGLDNLAMTLDDSRISGSVSRELPKEGSKAVPRTRFDLSIDALDVDRYLEPEKGATAGKPASAAADAPTEIPVDTIRGLNLDGRIRFGKLSLDGMPLSAVDVRATAGSGRLALSPLSAKLYGGNVAGTLNIDASGTTPRVALKQTFQHIDMAALLGAFADFHKLSGTMTLKLDAAGSGKTDDAVIRNLAGNLDFSLADGVYQGLDVWYEIRKARALIRRIPPPERSGPAQTPINTLAMSGRITDGTLHTDNLTAEIPFLRVSGKADVDLPGKSLDSELTALVFEKPVFGDDTSLEDLVGARIPLTIKGPLDDPKVRVDLQKMVKGALKESLRDLLRDKLGLGSPDQPAAEKPTEEGNPGEAPAAPAPKKEDRLKKALDKLLRG